MTVKAFCPGNASCIFRIVENKDKTKRHSLGVGFTVDKGVIVNVSKSDKTMIFANGKRIRFPTVLTVIRELTNEQVKVEIKDQLPSGAGFGISGASALATAYALNKLLNLKKPKKELAMVAHRAEVINGTGLGDVGGQFNGGFNIKIKEGEPLTVVNLGIKDVDIYYKFFSRIETRTVINSRWRKRRINKAGDRALKRIMALKNKTSKMVSGFSVNRVIACELHSPLTIFERAQKYTANPNRRQTLSAGQINQQYISDTLKEIIRVSKDFAVESGLLRDKRVKNLIEEIENKGGNASMIMLGNAVFSDIPFKGCRKVKISDKSACLL